MPKQVKRKREIPIFFRVTPSEQDLIKKNMKNAKISNMGSYLRRMAISGYVIELDLTEVKEFVKLLRNISVNINQIAKKTNETGSIFSSGINELQAHYDTLWNKANDILKELANIRSLM